MHLAERNLVKGKEWDTFLKLDSDNKISEVEIIDNRKIKKKK